MPAAAPRCRLALALALVALAPSCSASAGCSLACRSDPPAHDLRALCGAWQSRGKDDAIVEERWTLAPGGLDGEARTLDRHGQVTARERLTIRHAGDVTVYRAEPDGAAPTEFTELRDPSLAAPGEQLWVWQNLAHDFPRRIVYRVAGDRLEATVSDPDATTPDRRPITWEHRRVAPCAP